MSINQEKRKDHEDKDTRNVNLIIKNNIIIIIRTFPECFAPEKFQCKIT